MIFIDNNNIFRKNFITVEHFFKSCNERFKLKLLTNKSGFSKQIKEHNLHRPGLALAGFVDLFSYNRVQVLGNTEINYLKILSEEERTKSINKLFEFDIPCLIITNGHIPDKSIIDMANLNKIPIFSSIYPTTKLSYLVSDFLDDQFAPRLSIHGSFVDVYGVGILFVGNSGIGKSEVSLDLVERGHRLVADDVIILTKKGEGILMGSGTDVVRHRMELRGVGIIDVRNMFGIRAIRYQKRLEVIVELEIWDDKTDYTRTGLDEKFFSIIDVDIPYIKLPILPGKNITVISEVIALNYLLKHYGYDSAKEFQLQLQERLRTRRNIAFDDERAVDYFEHDFE